MKSAGQPHPLDIEAAKRSQWRAKKPCVEGHDRKFNSRLCAKHPSGVCSGCNGKQEAGRKAGRNAPCGQKHEGRSAANGMCNKRVWCSQKKIKKESLPPENSHDKKYRRYIFSIRRIENMTLNNPENAIYTYTARSETGNHDAMLEDLVFIARFPLAKPQMMCPITEYEILVKPGLFL